MESSSNAPTFWESYRNGVGLALGLATVYLLILALLGWLVSKQLETPTKPKESSACSTSWQT
ncbi:hypothetical protein [Meiothermus sp.]|uniref:Uncharacterized protein n=2 Tax=Meiothermus hypogaeus TaxID=884155 RepID=A0A511R2Q9_9DEIN|nr:hypothetical protein [Meiothermus sp.]RIH76672.1 hypothetical protein Mhypo_02352 [Meiothermus hypogaeus]GEM83898.1 hypothetical protein MHY01S_20640 [Meiothermus hypogaeus NBRC 106114]GIW33782.1 MAG: hypothetical protein KatS3mg072_1115 [Meiothermus sp.]GIW36283.1 MAG: hypothetical protein KatS3mg073_0428 [Meiothermus sp.]GIW38945.1 MAG: hypothetical protein KatS3mg075_426 [Meiothermus sp.]